MGPPSSVFTLWSLFTAVVLLVVSVHCSGSSCGLCSLQSFLSVLLVVSVHCSRSSVFFLWSLFNAVVLLVVSVHCSRSSVFFLWSLFSAVVLRGPQQPGDDLHRPSDQSAERPAPRPLLPPAPPPEAPQLQRRGGGRSLFTITITTLIHINNISSKKLNGHSEDV